MLSANFLKELESLLYKIFFFYVTAEQISVIMSCAHVATSFSGSKAGTNNVLLKIQWTHFELLLLSKLNTFAEISPELLNENIFSIT